MANISPRRQRRITAQWNLFFSDDKDVGKIQTGSFPTGMAAPSTHRVWKICIFQ